MLKGTIAIVANAERNLLPDITSYQDDVSMWIGVEKGALWILDNDFTLDYALGDFDSVSISEKNVIKKHAVHFRSYPAEKDQTDLEIAIEQALNLKPEKILLFGTTGGRKDHELVGIQMLYIIFNQGVEAVMVDKYNIITLKFPGEYIIPNDRRYPYISLLAFTPTVSGITLKGFKYPLDQKTIYWGSTLCISNELLSNTGTFFHDDGILLLIKSRDAFSDTIQK